MVVLVVNMHACVTYSHVGSWYVNEAPDPPLPIKLAFLFWQGHLQSFFMAILFLVAGYFAHGSLERRGPAGFVRERLVRLGLPTLL
jgi:glucan biosynthesis protein C